MKMDDYEKGLEAMAELFGRDYQFALATTLGDAPSCASWYVL
jgi:hypothetical protein